MKFNKFLTLLTIPFISSCSINHGPAFYSRTIPYVFNAFVDILLYEGSNQNLDDLEDMMTSLDILTDNYKSRPKNNVYTINNSSDDVLVDSSLYDLIKKAKEVKNLGATYFNPLLGSLNKKWKEALEKSEVLDSEVINTELEKINNSSIELKDNYYVYKSGDAEIDLGGIAKGYATDLAYDYLKKAGINKYMINTGRSSVLLGESNESDGYFRVNFEEYPNIKFRAKNCFISTSGNAVQGKEIGGVKYSHIINPITGSAINNYDCVVVLSNVGYLGDALSTSMMFNTIDEIKEIETNQKVKCIVIKDSQIQYINSWIEVI